MKQQTIKNSTIAGNRDLVQSHIRNLSKSIGEDNLLHVNPIIVNENFEVIDGQHRLEVAKNSNLPIYYIVLPDSQIDEVQRLNADNKAWALREYLESNIKRGKPEYQILKDYAQKFELSISIAVLLLTASLSKGQLRSGSLADFKAGRFQVQNLKEAIEFAEDAASIREYTTGHTYRHRGFLVAFQKVREQFPLKRLIEKFVDSGKKIEARQTVKDYLRQFEDVANFRAREEIRFF